jgi:hypothetical protein
MQVLTIIRKHYTNNKYFPKHIVFTMIYLMHKRKLNSRNYSEHETLLTIYVA